VVFQFLRVALELKFQTNWNLENSKMEVRVFQTLFVGFLKGKAAVRHKTYNRPFLNIFLIDSMILMVVNGSLIGYRLAIWNSKIHFYLLRSSATINLQCLHVNLMLFEKRID
jgi:hypothetical protein